MKRLLTTTTAIVAGALYFGVPVAPAHAAPMTLTDTWSIGTVTHQTGALPTLSIAANQSTSNDGPVSAKSDPFTEAMSLNTSVTLWLFVAEPGSSSGGIDVHTADIPINFTLNDGGTGVGTFTAVMDYYAKFSTQSDSMAWNGNTSTTPGFTSTGAFSQIVTLSDGEQVTVSMPHETDWNMAQAITFDVTAGPDPVPEPASLALLGFGLLGTVAFARRR